MGWVRGMAAIAWLMGGLAAAQPAPAAPAPSPEAVKFYQSGMANFRAGQFAQAIAEFKAADAISTGRTAWR